MVETAARFADVFALRGYDSVQLAAAYELHVKTEQKVLCACQLGAKAFDGFLGCRITSSRLQG
jgi:hypothetical protein